MSGPDSRDDSRRRYHRLADALHVCEAYLEVVWRLPAATSGSSLSALNATQVIAASKPRRRCFFVTVLIAVAAVLDAWLAPDHRYFKLRGEDDNAYLVRHDERSNAWEL